MCRRAKTAWALPTRAASRQCRRRPQELGHDFFTTRPSRHFAADRTGRHRRLQQTRQRAPRQPRIADRTDGAFAERDSQRADAGRGGQPIKETAMIASALRTPVLAGALAAAGLLAWAPLMAQTTPSPSTATAATALSASDRGFLKDAAQGGAAEVEASRLAQSKASNAEVKAFADQMVKDHGAANEELATLARGKGVELPNEPSLVHKAKEKMLQSKDGASFDRSYMDSARKDHEDTVKMFQKAAQSAKDPDVKAFAQKSLPTLQHHLDMARKINLPKT
jgi:putative membrane protein